MDGDSLVKFWEDDMGIHLDIRAYLEAGGEPYSLIMNQVNELQDGNNLTIHVPFEPRPLIAQLHRMGFKTEVRHEGVDHYGLKVFR